MFIDNEAKTSWPALIVIFLIALATGGGIYYWQSQQTVEEPVTITPTVSSKPAPKTQSQWKGWTETELTDGIYIMRPQKWGEKIVKNVPALGLDEGGPEAAPEHKKIGFADITEIEPETKDTEEWFLDNFIIVSDLEDYKNYESKGYTSGVTKIKEIYDARAIKKSDLFEKNIEGKYGPNSNLIMPYLVNAAEELHKYEYIESSNGEFRGYWGLMTFHQEYSTPRPSFIAILTDKKIVVKIDFEIETKKIEEFGKEYDEIAKTTGEPSYKALEDLQNRYFDFLSNIDNNDSAAVKKINELIKATKTLNSK